MSDSKLLVGRPDYGKKLILANRSKSVLTYCFLIAVACSSCATNNTGEDTTTNTIIVHRIEHGVGTSKSDSLRVYTEEASPDQLSQYRGYILELTAKENILISSRNVSWVRIILEDANEAVLIGKVEYVSGDEETENEKEEVAGLRVEIGLENIREIWVRKPPELTQKMQPKKPTFRDFEDFVRFLVGAGAILLVLALASI